MNDRKDIEKVQLALNITFSGLKDDPRLAQRVLAEAKGEGKVKKKLSAGLIVAIVLVLAAVTAAAAVLLGGKGFVSQVLAPMAQEDSSDTWTQEQTQKIIQQATENGLELPADVWERLNKAEAVYKEALMRAFAKIELGYYPASWSLEDQAWYDELLVQCGFRAERTRFLPENDEISEDEALQIANQYIQEAFSYQGDITSQDAYIRFVQYMLTEDEAGNPSKIWDIEYECAMEGMPSYYVCIASDGTILKEYSRMGKGTKAAKANGNNAAAIDELCKRIDQNDFFTVDSMAEFADKYGAMINGMGDLEGTKYSVLRLLLTIPYGKPSSTDMTQENAFQMARTEVLASGWKEEWLERCKYTISYRVYNSDRPEWRICFKLDGTLGDNYAYFHSGEMPFGIVVRLEAGTGKMLSIQQLNEMDRYDYYCEFPDDRDAMNTLINGVG